LSDGPPKAAIAACNESDSSGERDRSGRFAGHETFIYYNRKIEIGS